MAKCIPSAQKLKIFEMKTEAIKLSQKVIDAGVSAGKDYGYLVDYVGRAYLLLVALPTGRTRISFLAKRETEALFAEVVKQYMRETPWYGYLSLDKEKDDQTGEEHYVISKHEPWSERRELYAKKQEVTDEA
jgi:hypothetical protein